MNRTKIEWTDFVWNPIVGCKHNCDYCYARRMNDRFKFIEKWDEPQFFQDRMSVKAPSMPKNRNRIAERIDKDRPVVFVGSMADVFGSWVPKEWIQWILKYVTEHPDHLFMFLTKNPKRYAEFTYPENVMLGQTITRMHFTTEQIQITHLRWHSDQGVKTFMSIEPILGYVHFPYWQPDHTIVGAQTGPGAVAPNPSWIHGIIQENKNVHLKNNILKYI